MRSRIDDFFCLSLSAREGNDANQREAATLGREAQEVLFAEWIRRAREDDCEAGFLFLGTCHRVEFYAIGISPTFLTSLWQKHVGLAASQARLRRGEEALRHLLRVASSLESEVLGETQITGQLKEAAEWARQRGYLRGPLDRIIQNALRITKKIRTTTRLGHGTVSVAHVAVDGLLDVFESLENKKVLLIGAGSMAQQALERLQRRGAREISWVNRNREKIQNHALSSQTVIENFDKIPELVWQHSIIVAATSAPRALFGRDDLKRAKAAARPLDGPRVILDLGLPRNVDEKVHGYSGFYLRNVDEFSNRIEEASEQRRQQVGHAESILDEELKGFAKLWEFWAKAPLFKQLSEGLESLRKSEIDALDVNSSVEKKSKVEYITRGIYAKLLHRLLEEIETIEDPLSTEILEALVRAWRQPDQWPEKNRPLVVPLQKSSARSLDPSSPKAQTPGVQIPSPKAL